MATNPKIDLYLEEGCGRCNRYQTPDCKVHRWSAALSELRRIALETGLEEEYKWSQPTYTFNGKNVFIVSALNDFALLAFFKGSLLKDERELLVAPGANSQASRQFKFTDVKRIRELESTIKAYIYEAVEIEKAGLEVHFKERPEPMPEELEQAMEIDPDLKAAFENLTPGRQRGYILYFSQPKQSQTRINRIEKYRQAIIDGKGMHDDYRMNRKM